MILEKLISTNETVQPHTTHHHMYRATTDHQVELILYDQEQTNSHGRYFEDSDINVRIEDGVAAGPSQGTSLEARKRTFDQGQATLPPEITVYDGDGNPLPEPEPSAQKRVAVMHDLSAKLHHDLARGRVTMH